MSRLARYTVAAVLILAAVPTFAGAGETIKHVFVENTADNPVPVKGIGTQQVAGAVEVSNLPAVQRLRHGGGYVTKNADVMLPDDLVLTDLVITRLRSSGAPICEASLFEQGETELEAIQWFYPTAEDPTEELRLESGLRAPDDGWGIAVGHDCVLKVLWSGYSLS